MFNSLFGNSLGWIATCLDFVLTWILEMLNFNLSFFTDNFPVISTLYTILQGVGIALTIGIACFQLTKYFTGPLTEVTSNPIEIGVRALLSIALIWFGNYLLEGIVNLFSYPYQALLNVEQAETNIGISIMANIANGMAALLPGAAGTLLALIMLIAVGWNTVKLLLEVVERYLMVGVLTYTSPLAWPTLTSKNTQSIFSKWTSMFFGQCLLMLLNVWSIKMLISILGYSEANVFLRFVIALAFCKVAQRFDTYLQGLGINAAHTGGSLIDDIAAVGSTMSKIGSKAIGGVVSGAGNRPLGEALTKNGWMGGITYGIGNALSGVKAASDGAKAAGAINNAASTIAEHKKGQESQIFDLGNGQMGWLDKNSNLWSARDKASLMGIQSAVRQGYAQYQGESGISKNDKGAYQWTDANGVQHTSDNLPGILAQQQMARQGYTNAVPLGKESEIQQNPDGSYTWTDRSGNEYQANTFDGIQKQQAAITGAYMDNQGLETDIMPSPDGKGFQWTDKDGNVWKSNNLSDMISTRASVQAGYLNTANDSISNIRGRDMSAYAAQLVNPNGTFKSGVTTLDGAGREVIAGSSDRDVAQKIANISTPSAMATISNMGTVGSGDNISAIKASTIASRGVGTAQALMNSNVSGGIADERVAGATFETLFGKESESMPENGINSVIPGLSESVSSANGELIEGSGDVSDLKIDNGEMTGTYIPADVEGNPGSDEDMVGFSIRTQESYNSLSEVEQSGYTQFEGVDGESYYAAFTEAHVSETNIPQMTNHTSDVIPEANLAPKVSESVVEASYKEGASKQIETPQNLHSNNGHIHINNGNERYVMNSQDARIHDGIPKNKGNSGPFGGPSRRKRRK